MIFAKENKTNITLDGINAGPHAPVLSAWAKEWGPPSLLLQHGTELHAGYHRHCWAEWPGHLIAGSSCAKFKGRKRDGARLYALGRANGVALPLLRHDQAGDAPSAVDLHEIAGMHERVVSATVERLLNLPVTAQQAMEMRLTLPSSIRPFERQVIANRPMSAVLRQWSIGALRGTAWDLLSCVRAEALRCESQARGAADAVVKVYRVLRNMVGGDL